MRQPEPDGDEPTLGLLVALFWLILLGGVVYLREALLDQFQQIYLTAYDRMTRAVREVMDTTGLLVAYRRLASDFELGFPEYNHPSKLVRTFGFAPTAEAAWGVSHRRADYGLHALLTAAWKAEALPDTLMVDVFITSASLATRDGGTGADTYVFRLPLVTGLLIEGLFPDSLRTAYTGYTDVSMRRYRLAETIEEKALPKLTRQALARLTEMSMAQGPELPVLVLPGGVAL